MHDNDYLHVETTIHYALTVENWAPLSKSDAARLIRFLFQKPSVTKQPAILPYWHATSVHTAIMLSGRLGGVITPPLSLSPGHSYLD